MRRLAWIVVGLAVTGIAAWQFRFECMRALREATSPPVAIYPVGSHVEDKEALGGFGPSQNMPIDLGERPWGEPGKVSVVVDDDLATVRVVNRTDQVAKFPACDSCLYLFLEERDASGNWRPLEQLPGSWCGNSYHHVSLAPNQYWELRANVPRSLFSRTIRYRLIPDGANPRESIFSREFKA